MAKAVLKAKADLDPRGFKAGAKGVTNSVKGIKSQLGAVKGLLAGAFAAGALVQFGRGVISLGSELSDLATQAGVSTDTLQAFEAVMLDAGNSSAQSTKALNSLRDAQDAAVAGEKPLQDAFEALGLTMAEVARMTTDELLIAVSKGATETGNFGATVDIFGKRLAGSMQEPMQVLSKTTFPELTDKMKEAGRVIDSDMIESLDKFEDKLGQVNRQLKVWVVNLVETAQRNIGDSANWVQGFIGSDGSIKERLAAAKKLVNEVNKMEEEEEKRAQAKREQKQKKDQARDVARRVETLEKAEEVAEGKAAGSSRKSGSKAPASVRGAAGSSQSFSELRSIGANVLGAGVIRKKEDKQIKVLEESKKIQSDMLTTLKTNITTSGAIF